jgi:DNA-binding CsgD family transcriptional regulator
MRQRTARRPRRDLAALERSAARVESLAELAESPLLHLTSAVHASSSMLFQFEAQGPRIVGGALRDAMSSYCEEYFEHDEIQKAAFRARHIATPLVLAEWSGINWSTHRKSLAYADFYQRTDVEWMLCVHLDEEAHGTPGQTGIVLSRARNEPPFGSDELRVAQHAALALRVAMRRTRRLAALQREIDGAHAVLADRAVLTVGSDGRIEWLSRRAEVVAAGFLAPGERLRSPLAELVQQLFADVTRGGAELGVKVRARVRPEPRLDAELWLTQSRAGVEVAAVELHEAALPHAREAARRLATRHGLTAAERGVLTLLGEAMTNREIAARLACSLETVRTHVARVLGKLGARSRVEAALLLTREAQHS